MRSANSPRRFLVVIAAAITFVFILFIASFRPENQPHNINPSKGENHKLGDSPGKAIAPKLGNETIKAELGRAAWKVLHTTLARFPEKPSKDESSALRQYINLFQRLYPCGECSEHFAQVLQSFPPQVSSRNAAAGWGCHVHNQVNEKLGKPLFDCTKIGDFYDCGCAED